MAEDKRYDSKSGRQGGISSCVSGTFRKPRASPLDKRAGLVYLAGMSISRVTHSGRGRRVGRRLAESFESSRFLCLEPGSSSIPPRLVRGVSMHAETRPPLVPDQFFRYIRRGG